LLQHPIVSTSSAWASASGMARPKLRGGGVLITNWLGHSRSIVHGIECFALNVDESLSMGQGAIFYGGTTVRESIVEALAADWRSAGVKAGDTLLVHSSLARTLRRVVKMGGAADPGIIVESFLRALGPSGTLLAPLFNFEFTQGVPFDIRESKSAMGSFTECVRNWPGSVRTGHPIYSFAVVGASAGEFSELENFSGYGADSPFALLHKMKGKIGVIDLPDQRSMTFYHYVEESQSVPYRYHKTFTGSYTGWDGLKSDKTFGLFVRDVEKGVLTKVDPMGEILWEKGIYTGDRPGTGCGLRVVSAASLFDEVVKVIDSGRAKGILYDVQ
jgi:aminoglycoside 3-N-acetyltransferase